MNLCCTLFGIYATVRQTTRMRLTIKIDPPDRHAGIRMHIHVGRDSEFERLASLTMIPKKKN